MILLHGYSIGNDLNFSAGFGFFEKKIDRFDFEKDYRNFSFRVYLFTFLYIYSHQLILILIN